RWSDVWWGADASDQSRAMLVQETRARGRHIGPTKSGRDRRVAMSRRLRGLLMERWLAAGRPKGKVRILPGIDPSNYRSRHFARVCRAAGLATPKPEEKPLHSPKDLRDTFASQLITAGIQLGYVSQQLGHADVAVTARHYARWAAGDAYRSPMVVGEGELPADLLMRIAESASESHQSHISSEIGA
ncbi:MAG: tyrosine-type recombinase/integrase, partial [Deltaproteobacteria bacterium]|nr:tyrosine-type recombinase/integrase [Deltaproteobacteria bacterium]